MFKLKQTNNQRMSYKLSSKAEQDLRHIYQYTQQRFGEGQAAAYLLGLEECLLQTSANPAIAQKIDDLRPNYKRYL